MDLESIFGFNLSYFIFTFNSLEILSIKDISSKDSQLNK